MPHRRAWGRGESCWAKSGLVSQLLGPEHQRVLESLQQGTAALCVCDGDLQMVPGSEEVTEEERGPLHMIIQPGFPGGSEQPWGGAEAGCCRGGAGAPLPR